MPGGLPPRGVSPSTPALQWRTRPQRRDESLQGRADLGPEERPRCLFHGPGLLVERASGHLVGTAGDVLDRLHLRVLGDAGHAVLERADLAGKLGARLDRVEAVAPALGRRPSRADPINAATSPMVSTISASRAVLG